MCAKTKCIGTSVFFCATFFIDDFPLHVFVRVGGWTILK
jgi:hypothetical protein